MSTITDNKRYYESLRNKPNLDRNGPWLLKFDNGERRVWVNEINRRKKMREQVKRRGHWVSTRVMIDYQWFSEEDL